MLKVIWGRIMVCELLVIVEWILMLWFIGLGCIIIVFGLVSVSFCGVRL